ncbi:MAG TPA: zinc ribbon domain-containing protein [Thermomicrobiales bacterium]|nr:zinc ribbon domain-containing protein [Thermomicrobiales bacterium]
MALRDKQQLSRKNAKRDYWLRGLIRCANCGAAYCGCAHHGKRRYACTKRFGVHTRIGDEACGGKLLPADRLEAAVWAECRAFVLDPGAALEEARRAMRARLAEATGFADRRSAVLVALAEKDAERERVLTAYRKGWASDEEAQAQLDAVARHAGHLREELETLRARAALVEAQEATLAEGAALLATLQTELAAIEEADDWTARAAVMARLVRVIDVETRRVGPRRREAEVRVWLRLRPGARSVDTSTSAPTPNPHPVRQRGSTPIASTRTPAR